MKETIVFIAFCAVLYFAVAVMALGARDDTDPPDGRSGMVLLTDNLTGCQYLKAPGYWNAALTPRMAADGRQVCRATK